MSQADRQRHQLRGLARRKAKNEPLISRAGFSGQINPLRDLPGLRAEQVLDLNPVGMEVRLRIGVSDFPDGRPRDCLEIHAGI